MMKLIVAFQLVQSELPPTEVHAEIAGNRDWLREPCGRSLWGSGTI